MAGRKSSAQGDCFAESKEAFPVPTYPDAIERKMFRNVLKPGVKDFPKYRKLPISKFKPPYFEGFLRAYTWLFTAIGFINSAYALILFKNLHNKNLLTFVGSWSLAALFFLLHLFLYWLFSEIRNRKEIPGVGKEA